MIRKIALLLMKDSNSVTVPEVKEHSKETELSTEDIAFVMERLAIERTWDWQSDGTHRKYTLAELRPTKSEREECFIKIRTAIENSKIDCQFKDIALYDLEQARISYESRAFKACIVMFGAVIEGLMLGIIRNDSTNLTKILKDPKAAPNVLKKLGLGQFSKSEELADNISENLNFEGL